MPIIIRESSVAPRLIGTAAATLALLLTAALVIFAPWQLPHRIEDSWDLPIDLEFPEIAQRIFRKIDRRAPEIDPVRPAPDTSPEVRRAKSRPELLDNAEGPKARSLDDRPFQPTDPTGIDRAPPSNRPADIIVPTSGTPATAQDLTGTGTDPHSVPSAPPSASVDRGPRSGPPRSYALDLAPGTDPAAALLAWMRAHPAPIEPQVETFLLSATGRPDLASRLELRDRGKSYVLYLAAIVDRDDEARSEIRIGLLDRSAAEIARIIDPGLRGEVQSLKVGRATAGATGRVVWVDANPRATDDGRWYSVVKRLLEGIGQ